MVISVTIAWLLLKECYSDLQPFTVTCLFLFRTKFVSQVESSVCTDWIRYHLITCLLVDMGYLFNLLNPKILAILWFVKSSVKSLFTITFVFLGYPNPDFSISSFVHLTSIK